MRQKPDTCTIARSRYLPLAEVAVALAILAGTIAFAAYTLREQSRAQITGQHGQILYNLWLSQRFAENSDMLVDGSEASDQLPSMLLTARLPQLQGLWGTRLFDTNGDFFFADANIAESTLSPEDLAALRELRPVARLREAADLREVNVTLTERVSTTLLEVSIPLHTINRQQFTGVGQFILDGRNLAEEFRQLDRNLLTQAALNFLVGGGLLGVFLMIGFRQVQRGNRLLAERTQSLLKANQELALAAKTSAVGAVTAHLIHGLKNPLSGLQNFVASRVAETEEGMNSDWQMAVSSTRRMHTMISEIVRVLQDEGGDGQYELSLREFAEVLCAKVRPLAREGGVQFESRITGEGSLTNREANLINLVLCNLLQNAIQATPPGKTVSLALHANEGRMVCEVRDEGGGFSEAQRASLFMPCRSNKEGGSGIGLAISKQLANSIGAELVLQETSPAGSLFVLTFVNCPPISSDQLGHRTNAQPARFQAQAE